MIIKATPTCPSILDLSSRERLQEENIEEAKTFHLTLRHGNTVRVEDQWYILKSIQGALKLGYIEILDFKQQHYFSQEVSIPEKTTTNYDLTEVMILNRADYPQQAFEKINKNFETIDAALTSGGTSNGDGADLVLDGGVGEVVTADNLILDGGDDTGDA